MERRWGGRVPALLLILTIGLASCTGSSDEVRQPDRSPSPSVSATPASGGRIAFGVLGEPPTLDPYSPRATDLTYALARPVYPSLFRFAPDGSVEAGIAESLTETDGGARAVLADFRWSDGSPVTARDVVLSVRRARPPSGFARLQARAVDRSEVVLRGRVDEWEQTLATAAFVLPRGRAQRPGGKFGGPFVIARRTPGLEVVYQPNPSWPGPDPHLDRLVVRFVAGFDTMLALLERGALDAAATPSTVNLDERLDALELSFSKALGWESLYVDFSRAAMARDERLGFVSNVDRAVMAEGLVRDDGRISDTLHPAPGDEGAAGPFSRLGRAPAPSESLLVTGPAGDELIALVMRIIQRQLDDAGTLVEIAGAAPSAVYGGGEGDPGGIKVLRAAGIPGLEDRPGAGRQLTAWPLFHVATYIAHDPRVQGIEVNPTIEGALWNAEFWWVGAP